MTKYRCPRCSQAGEWTDGMSVAAGDERDEYWCQYCGEESPLTDCEVVEPIDAVDAARARRLGEHSSNPREDG